MHTPFRRLCFTTIGGLTLAFVPLGTPLTASAQQNENINQRPVNVSKAALLPAALAEFLDVYEDQIFVEKRDDFFKEWRNLTLTEREKKLSILYRAANNDAEPPNLKYAQTKKILSSYPENRALDEIIRVHAHSVDLFRATWFPDEQVARRPGPGHPEYAVEIGVTPGGIVYTNRRIWDWAVQGSSSDPGATKRAAMSASVRQALKILPSGETLVPLDRLVILTFRNEKGWETRLYDRSKLPPAVANLFDTTEGESWARTNLTDEKKH